MAFKNEEILNVFLRKILRKDSKTGFKKAAQACPSGSGGVF
jgi:hypothetical protein